MLIQSEEVYRSFKGARDSVHFTSKRIIAVNVQGITGKKTDYSSLPYSKIQAWSVETAGRFDRDCELDMWCSGLGEVRLELAGSVDIKILDSTESGIGGPERRHRSTSEVCLVAAIHPVVMVVQRTRRASAHR